MVNHEREKFHPGYYLKQDLKELKMSPVEFSLRSGLLEKQVNDLLDGKIGVTGEIAGKLSVFFGSSASLWLGLQADYDTYIRQKRA
jgi:addiction module HigA family antidote